MRHKSNLEVHHKEFRIRSGDDSEQNLITLGFRQGRQPLRHDRIWRGCEVVQHGFRPAPVRVGNYLEDRALIIERSPRG
jgi:hypothetical protein